MALNERILPTEEGGDIARALNKWATSKTQDPTIKLVIWPVDYEGKRLYYKTINKRRAICQIGVITI